MKTLLAACLFAALLPGADRVVMNLEKSPHARVKNVPVSAVTMGPGFWQPRMRTNVERSIPTLLALLEEHGIVDNFRRLAGKNARTEGTSVHGLGSVQVDGGHGLRPSDDR